MLLSVYDCCRIVYLTYFPLGSPFDIPDRTEMVVSGVIYFFPADHTDQKQSGLFDDIFDPYGGHGRL